MELEGNGTPTHRILGNDTPKHASIVKQEMEKIGVRVNYYSTTENNVVIVFDVPVNIDMVGMFQRMSECLQDTL